MEGSPTNGPRGEDWLFEGGSRAQVAAKHEYRGDEAGPAWLTKKEGDKVEMISEDGGVAQVYAKFDRGYGYSAVVLTRVQRSAKTITVPTSREYPERRPTASSR